MTKREFLLRGVSAGMLTLSGMIIFAGSPSHAQSALSATVVPNGNHFECVASGTNVSIGSSHYWTWGVVIDGAAVDYGFHNYFGPAPWILSILSVDVLEPPTMELHGYHTCRFYGQKNASTYILGDLWDTGTVGYTFP